MFDQQRFPQRVSELTSDENLDILSSEVIGREAFQDLNFEAGWENRN